MEITPEEIRMPRPSKEEVIKERGRIKKELRAQLSERGDIAHIHRLLNKRSPITYAAVLNALNPNTDSWSRRVIEFTQQYLAARAAMKEGNQSILGFPKQ